MVDKLSIFGTSTEVSLISESNKTIDDVTDGLESIANGQEDVLRQLQLTHIGHEEELWGKEFAMEDNLDPVDRLEEDD